MPKLSWRALVVWALAGTAVALLWVLLDLSVISPQLGTLVDTSPSDPSAQTLRSELGDDAVVAGGKHDGAYFYVIARDPFDLNAASARLDGPRYRLQRIGYPMAAWMLHPTGGGVGLMWAMFAVVVVSLIGGGVALGALSQTLRGPPWVAVVFPLLLGSWVSLRIAVADPMAVALSIGAVVLLFRNKLGLSLVLGVAAALTRETSLLVFIGLALGVRTKRPVLLAAVPAVVVAAWTLALTALVPVGDHAEALALPFTGFPLAIERWTQLLEPLGVLAFLIGLVVVVLAFRRSGFNHPFAWILVLQLGFLTVLTSKVLVPERSMTRQMMVLTAFGAVMALTPQARSVLARSDILGFDAQPGLKPGITPGTGDAPADDRGVA